ncbi:fungal specific transcription factor domain-containing protein [Paecilomyces variotii No. 5]|uniref:Fungal specific transcription factor domain-containing protein n=1 Tax=Byssochlamys spectabilis (strain No. 5 / NBRC 109023) TaxID=1356009 RepID=V5HUN6_BYSSN|nr:fungal specific transcription factor domain-containing protein [Paecilomyces variotii No. 5]
MAEGGQPIKEEVSKRKIHIETRFGRARRSRSRKDRPCDACRHRKSACVITVQPPCRYCEGKGQDCTFASSPTERVRKKTTTIKSRASTSDGSGSLVVTPRKQSGDGSPDKLSASVQLDVPRANEFSTYGMSIFQHDNSAADPAAGSTILPAPMVYNAHSLNQTPLANVGLPMRDNQGRLSYGSESHISLDHSCTRLERPEETLDDVKGLTAHFLGPSSDQDANLLSSFRSNILNETSYVDVNIRQVFPGNGPDRRPPIHFNIVHDLFPDRDNRAKQLASERIEALVGSYGDALIRLYFRFVHPAFPVLSKARFLKSYSEDRFSIPASLRGVVYGLACPFWEHDDSLRSQAPISQHELFDQVHIALNRELDSPKLSTLQACLLVLHETPPLTQTTESPRNWTLACQATSCAQNLGLQQDPSLWNIPTWEKSLRKKLWWATFATDKWSSLSHGHPSHIPQSSFDTTDLSIEDLLVEEDVTDLSCGRIISETDRRPNQARAVNFLETVRLAKLLATLLDYAYAIREPSLLAPTTTGLIDQSLYVLRAEMDGWYAMLPQCLSVGFAAGIANMHKNGPLHLAYFSAKSLLLRVLMSPATPLSKSNPFSNLRTHFDSTLEEFSLFVNLVSSIRAEDLCAFWGRRGFENSSPEQVEKSYALLEGYRHALRNLADVADQAGTGLIRPALLRTESFFKEAIKIMRKGGAED